MHPPPLPPMTDPAIVGLPDGEAIEIARSMFGDAYASQLAEYIASRRAVTPTQEDSAR